MSGWIKIHRKMLKNPVVFKDADHLAVWMYLLLTATHAEKREYFKGEVITLKPGQLLTGRKSIASKTNVTESKVQRVLRALEGEQQIEQQTSNQNRLITILQWGKYQEGEQQSEQQLNSDFDDFSENQNQESEKMNNEMDSDDSAPNPDNDSITGDEPCQSEQRNEQQLNNERTTSEQRVNTYKNVKNDKNVNNARINNIGPDEGKSGQKNKNKPKESMTTILAGVQDDALRESLSEFHEHRKSLKKPMTPYAMKRFVAKLDREFDNDAERTHAVNVAIERGWLSVEREWMDNLRAKSVRRNSRSELEDYYDRVDRWAEEMERGGDLFGR